MKPRTATMFLITTKARCRGLTKNKEVVVFCSHFHQDHFNPKIFEILDDMGVNYQAVLAKDIGKKKYPAGVKITTAYHDQTYILDNGIKVSTLLSTDSGVAFYRQNKRGLNLPRR